LIQIITLYDEEKEMDIFSILQMIGGLALFLYGMTVMGDGLSQASGGKLEQILEKLTSNKLKAVALGAGVTAVIQSSSATTVMVVGFVNSGIMKLTQAVGTIMGANIGTTATSWILSLSGIEGDSWWIQILKPTSFSPILAIIGVALLMFAKTDKKRDVATVMIGFAILMTGMETMSAAVKPLANVPEFTSVLTMFSNPLLGVLAGAILTAIIQSSSASVGILQALCLTGAVSYGTALPIIMGQNIGTCITAMLSSIGANKNAKRAAFVHLYFNLIGTVIFMIVFYTANIFVKFSFMGDAATPAGIAVIHSLFNIFATVVLFPFSDYLVRLACFTVRDEEGQEAQEAFVEELQILDSRFLEKPAFAITQCRTVAIQMAEMAKKALFTSMGLFDRYSEETVEAVKTMESQVDRYEDELGTYLMKLSSKTLSQKDSQTLSMLLHCIGDFERISDHALNIAEVAKEMHSKGSSFSSKAEKELKVFSNAIEEIVNTAMDAFSKEDIAEAERVEPLEEVIDEMNDELKKRHIKRLRKGKCTIEMGFVLSDLTTNYERVADHCSNIAVCLLQIQEDGMDVHEYLDVLKQSDNENFRKNVLMYAEKYALP